MPSLQTFPIIFAFSILMGLLFVFADFLPGGKRKQLGAKKSLIELFKRTLYFVGVFVTAAYVVALKKS